MANQVLSNKDMCSVTLSFLKNDECIFFSQVNSTVRSVVQEYFGVYSRILQVKKESCSLFKIAKIVQRYAGTCYKPIPMASLLTLMKGEGSPSRLELSLLFFLKENRLEQNFIRSPCSKAALSIVHAAGTVFRLLDQEDSLQLCRDMTGAVTTRLVPILKAVSCLSPTDRERGIENYCNKKGINWFAKDRDKKTMKSLLACFNEKGFSRERFF